MDLLNAVEKAIHNLKDLQGLTDGVLSPIDNALETSDDLTKNKFLELLSKAEEKIRRVGGKKQDWWLSEIYLRKGRCARGIFDSKEEYPLWKHAYEYAIKADNHEVQVQSSLELGFSFVEFTTSLRVIAEIQMDCIQAICAGDVATTSRLRIIGINLFDFWRQLEYRRLSEHDLKAKQFLIDGAKNLEKGGFDDHSAAPVMILLISKLFDFEDPGLEWAHMEITILGTPIPEDIKRKIK